MRLTWNTLTYSTITTLTLTSRKQSQIPQQTHNPTLQIAPILQQKTHYIVIKSVAVDLSTGLFLLSQSYVRIPTVVSMWNSLKLSILALYRLGFLAYSLVPRFSIGWSIIPMPTLSSSRPVRSQDLGTSTLLPCQKSRYSWPVLSTWVLILSRIQQLIGTENTCHSHILQSIGTGKSSATSMSVHLALQQTPLRGNGSTN